jgi:hypothetical protein
LCWCSLLLFYLEDVEGAEEQIHCTILLFWRRFEAHIPSFQYTIFRLSTIWDGENTNCRECFTVVKIHFFGRTKLTKVRRELLAPLNFSEEVGSTNLVLYYEFWTIQIQNCLANSANCPAEYVSSSFQPSVKEEHNWFMGNCMNCLTIFVA